jgi:hypothetical protein
MFGIVPQEPLSALAAAVPPAAGGSEQRGAAQAERQPCDSRSH